MMISFAQWLKMMLHSPGRLFGGLVLLVFFTTLSGYVVLGSKMRLSGDDYCYAALVQERGFWGAQEYSYFNEVPYSGNRFSLTLFSDLAELAGPRGNGVLPGLAIGLWVVGLAIAIKQGSRFVGDPIPIVPAIAASSGIVFLTLYEAPMLGQVLYWRSGMLPYLAPLVLGSWSAAWIFAEVWRPRWPVWSLLGIALLSWLGAGFSETAGALQTGVLAVALVLLLFIRLKNRYFFRKAIGPVSVAFLATMAAMVLMFIAPSNRSHQLLFTATPDILRVSLLSLSYTRIFVQTSVLKLFWPNLFTVVLFSLLALLVMREQRGRLSWKNYLLLTASAIVLCFTWIICCCAPSAYATTNYPADRALTTARYVMVLTGAVIGWLAGWKAADLGRNSSWMGRSVVPIFLGLGLLIFPLNEMTHIYQDLPKYRRWAVYWDARDQLIRNSAKLNQADLQVMEIDHIIPWVSELRSDSGYWINACAAKYYGVSTIRANQPGWDQ